MRGWCVYFYAALTSQRVERLLLNALRGYPRCPFSACVRSPHEMRLHDKAPHRERTPSPLLFERRTKQSAPSSCCDNTVLRSNAVIARLRGAGKKRKRRSRDNSYGLAFNGLYILLLHTKMTPYNIRPFRLLTDRFRISSVSLQPCATKSMFLYLYSPRGGSTGVKRFQSARVNFPNQCPPSHYQQQNVACM